MGKPFSPYLPSPGSSGDRQVSYIHTYIRRNNDNPSSTLSTFPARFTRNPLYKSRCARWAKLAPLVFVRAIWFFLSPVDIGNGLSSELLCDPRVTPDDPFRNGERRYGTTRVSKLLVPLPITSEPFFSSLYTTSLVTVSMPKRGWVKWVTGYYFVEMRIISRGDLIHI